MNRIFFTIGLLSLLILGGCNKTATINKSTEEITKTIPATQEIFSFVEQDYDFGIIKQSAGKVTHDFKFTYNGDEPINITGVPTSCACTSTKVSKTKLNSGESAVLTVKFNPNLHAEPEDKFFKTITLLTEPKIEDMPEVKIWAEIDLDLGEEAFELKSDHDDEEGEEEEDGLTSYQSITPEKFAEMMENKDFTLIDTHIPLQDHIDGTDLVIAYNEIEHNAKLPTDKDAKIVLYCRSGSMSRAAAYQLVEQGYTNVYDLVGGKIGYDEFLGER